MRKKLEEYIADNPAIIIVILLLTGLAVVALIPERVMGAFFVILKFLLNAFLVLLIAAAVLLFFIHSAKNMIRAVKAKAVRENLSVFAIPIFAFIVIALATFFGGWMAACVALIPLAPLAYIYWVTSDVVEKSEPKQDRDTVPKDTPTTSSTPRKHSVRDELVTIFYIIAFPIGIALLAFAVYLYDRYMPDNIKDTIGNIVTIAVFCLVALFFLVPIISSIFSKHKDKKETSNEAPTETSPVNEINPTPTNEDAPPAWSDGDKYL